MKAPSLETSRERRVLGLGVSVELGKDLLGESFLIRYGEEVVATIEPVNAVIGFGIADEFVKDDGEGNLVVGLFLGIGTGVF